MTRDIERLIAADVAFCQAMTDELEDYLRSNVLFWEPNRRVSGVTLPKLTIGGFLLAIRQLETLRERLSLSQQQVLERAKQELELQTSQWRIRYEAKLERDLRSRLDAWTWYLDDLEQNRGAAAAYYVRQVDTRVKIDLLMEVAKQLGMALEPLRQRQLGLDEQLRLDFTPNGFIWPDPLAPGFPAERFWYLWGYPSKGDD